MYALPLLGQVKDCRGGSLAEKCDPRRKGDVVADSRGERIAMAVRAELGSAGLLSWHQRWCPRERRWWPKAACSETRNLKRGKVAKRCILQILKGF